MKGYLKCVNTDCPRPNELIKAPKNSDMSAMSNHMHKECWRKTATSSKDIAIIAYARYIVDEFGKAVKATRGKGAQFGLNIKDERMVWRKTLEICLSGGGKFKDIP